jgi:hypothetical protein
VQHLEHLEHPGPPRRWVLKSPDHVHGLEALFTVFPDALIIQTHRNPIEVLKSSSHLTEVLHGLYAWPGPRDQLVARETKLLAETANRFIHYRDSHPEQADRFLDVRYEEIASDPLAVIRRIYDKFELPLSDEAVARMERLARGRSRYVRRQPWAAPVELEFEGVAEAACFERYCSRFKVGWRQAQ